MDWRYSRTLGYEKKSAVLLIQLEAEQRQPPEIRFITQTEQLIG